MNIVIFYGKNEYIIELKIWHGNLKHGEGIEQLAEYMDIRKQNKGWLLTFCFNRNKEIIEEKYTSQIIEFEGKNIVSVVCKNHKRKFLHTANLCFAQIRRI